MAEPKLVAYTFRTFPKETLEKYGLEDVFIFGKLKEDLAQFLKLYQGKNIHVIGFALAPRSQVELKAVNKFNRGKISQVGPPEITLHNRLGLDFAANQTPRTSFCNWTAYQIAQHFPTSFYHVKESDLSLFLQTLQISTR